MPPNTPHPPQTTLPPQPTTPSPVVSPSPAHHVALILMIICWAAAVLIGLWGSVRQARHAALVRREARTTGRNPGPTPGLEGFLDRWAVWSLVLLGLGLACLGYASVAA